MCVCVCVWVYNFQIITIDLYVSPDRVLIILISFTFQ